MAFERIVNLKTPFPLSGLACSVGKNGVTFSPKLSATISKFKRADVLYDRDAKRLGFVFLNGAIPGSYKLRSVNGAGSVPRCFISMRKLFSEIGVGVERQILPVKQLDAKEVPEGYKGSKVYCVELKGGK